MNILDRDQRSQVGIGTIMLFIAMVLVAAIAAGVLLESSGYLKSSALATGEESTQQTQDSLIVQSTRGQLNNVYAVANDAIVLNESGFVVRGDQVNSDEVIAYIVAEDKGRVTYDGLLVQGPDGVWEAVEEGTGANILDSGINPYIEENFEGQPAVLGDGDNIIIKDSGNSVILENGTNVEAEFDPDFSGNTVISEGDKVGQISLTVGKGPGSGPISLDDVTLQYLGPHGMTNLVRAGSEGSSSADTFTTTSTTNVESENTIINRGEYFKIIIDIDASSGALQPLEKGEEADITMITPSGNTRTKRVRVVDNFDGNIRRLK